MKEQNSPNLYVSCDRMNTIWFRYWSHYEETGKTLSGDAVKEHISTFKREVHFLVRRSCDLEFHQYLNHLLDYTKKKGRKKGLTVRKHMKELTRYILLDKIRQQQGIFLTTNDILAIKDIESEEEQESLSYGHLHRVVNEYYPELLTTRIELRERLGKRKYDNDRKIEDHRERIVETQFTLQEKIPPNLFEVVVKRGMPDIATTKFLEQMRFQGNIMSQIMMCDPIDLAKLLEFKEDVCEIIEEIRENPFLEDEDSVEWDVFRDSAVFNYLVQSLFLQIRVLVELRWFRDKSEDIQNKLIYREPQYPKYRRKDAEKAIKLAFNWYGRSELVIQIMSIASLAYFKLGDEYINTGLWLYQQILSQLELTDDWKAHVLYNIGITHLHLGQERLMLRRLQESIEIHERLGNHPGDLADTYGYLAQYWRIKDRKKYLYYRNLAEALLKEPILSKRRRLIHYRLLSDCAVIHQDKAWEKRLYELGLKYSLHDDKLEEFALWFSQCLNDLDIMGERGPEIGPGRIPPPQELRSIHISPSFKMTILDPDPE